MTQELAVRDAAIPQELTVAQVAGRVQKVHDLMRNVLKEGINNDYAKIPGTPKPALLLPGAEKIALMFQFSASYITEDLCTDLEARYRVTCRLEGRDGTFLGDATCECSSFESKAAWRAVTGDGEWNDTPEEKRRVLWKSGVNGEYQTKQVRTEKADQLQRTLMMARKRAFVAAVRAVGACSDLFTQDEDIIQQGKETASQPPIAKPQAKQETAPNQGQAGNSVITHVGSMDTKSGTSKTGKPYTKYFVETTEPEKYSTFDKKIAESAEALLQTDGTCRISFTVGQYGKEITAIEQASEAAE